MIALAIYLLEKPLTDDPPQTAVNGLRSIVNYLTWPAIWTVAGLLSALAAQVAYIPLSGNADNPEIFASSFNSDLLWYLLWPNELFPLGIVPAILIVSGPLIILLVLATRQWQRLHPVRWLGLWAMILVLFFGSLVVSTKIGGGGDLHNMDAYAALLGIVAAYFIGDKVAGESESNRWNVVRWPVTAIALVIPVMFLIPSLSPIEKFDKDWADSNAGHLKSLAESADGPVLFITERHFVTFGQIDVPMVPEYERVTLMEAAMSNNQKMLGQFYADLQSHRFALIVSGKENLIIKEGEAFAEENNAWNKRVSPYILCYYEPVALLEPERSRIQVFAPRATPGDCP